MELFETPEEMCTLPYQDLIEMTKCSEGNVVEEAEMYGFVIIPEAYAGLQSLTYSRRLSRGNMHLLVDIGGGTTDIAFFTIDESLMPSIHTVASFHKGLNFVLENYLKEHPGITMVRLRTCFGLTLRDSIMQSQPIPWSSGRNSITSLILFPLNSRRRSPGQN